MMTLCRKINLFLILMLITNQCYATNNVVPVTDGVETLGTTSKRWGHAHLDACTVQGTVSGVTVRTGDFALPTGGIIDNYIMKYDSGTNTVGWEADVGAPDQSLWETIDTDGGSVTADSTTDTLTIAGGGINVTSQSGDTITVTATEVDGSTSNELQNLWATVDSDSGSTVANSQTDTLTIAGAGIASTAVSGDTLTITATEADGSTTNELQDLDDVCDRSPVTDQTISAGNVYADTTVSGINVIAINTITGVVVDAQFIEYSSGGALTVRDDLTIEGDIASKKTSAQGYTYTYDTTLADYIRNYHDGTNAYINSNVGDFYLTPAGKDVYVGTSGSLTDLFVNGRILVQYGTNDTVGDWSFSRSQNWHQIGTADADDFRIKTDGTGRLYFESGGDVEFQSTVNKIKHAGGTFDFDDDNIVTTETVTGVVVDTQFIDYSSGGGVTIRDDLTINGDTTTNNITLNDAGQITLDVAPASDHTGTGIIASMTVDANTYGIASALHMDTDGNWIEADADGATTIPCGALALETGTGTKKVLLQGVMRDDTWTWTKGGILYVSEIVGTLTQDPTEMTDTGDQVQAVGYAITDKVIYFSPDFIIVEIE